MTTVKGFGQDRAALEMHGAGTAGKRRGGRTQAKLAGQHSTFREIGVGTNDPAKATHILRETAGAGVLVERIETSTGAGSFQGRKARGAEDARTAVASGDDLLSIEGIAYVGANNGYQPGARITYEVDGSVSDAEVGAPTRMTFLVATGTGSSLDEKMRITSTGKVGIGMNNPSTKVTVEGAVTLKEQAAADADVAAYGQVWVKTATPNELYFTTDAGNDIQITSGTTLAASGMTSFQLEDGDGTEVAISDAKEVKFVEGTGIDINWTDTDNGTDGDPYDLTFTVNLEGTELVSTGETGGSKFLREDGDGTCSWQTVSGSGGMTSFQLEDGDGTEVAISDAKEVKFVEGGGIDINWTDTSHGTDGDPYDLTFTVADTTVAGDSGSTGITPGDTLTIAGGTNVTTAMSGDTLTVTSTDTNTQLSTEQVQDIVGAMFSSNTETRCTVTYQDGDGTIDVEVDDLDTNLTTEQVQDIVGAMFSSNTETRITATYEDGDGTIDLVVDDMTADTNTMGSGFVLEDGDGTEVTITENKEVKFVEGTGIDIDWTDVSPGSDADPYDLTFTVNLEGTELVSTGETGGSKFLREDGDGTCSWQTVSGGGSGDVVAGSTFTTAGVIMACDGDDKTIDEPTALLTTNGQGMTVSAALATPFQVDNSTRDGNATFKFTTGSASGTNNQASLQVIAQTAANANLNLGDTASATKGGLKYKNSGDSMQLIAAGNAVLELDSAKVVEFKIAEDDDASGTDYSYASKALKIKVNGTDYWLQLYEEGGGMGGP